MKLLERFQYLIPDAVFVARKHGGRAAAQLVGRRVGTVLFLYRRYLVLCHPLSDSLPTPIPPDGYSVRRAMPQDLPALAALVGPGTARLFARRMAMGRVCFIALKDSEVVSYTWGTFDTSWDLDYIELPLPTGTAYYYGSFTASDHRRQGLLTALTGLQDQHFRAMGARHAIGLVERHNKPSLAMWRSFGSRQMGTFTHLRVLGWEWVRRIALNPE